MMNNNNNNLSSCVFLLVAALMLVSASSSLLIPHNKKLIQAKGTLYCTPTGNPTGNGTQSNGAPNVTIALICKSPNNTISVIAKGVTDQQGMYNITARVPPATVGYLEMRACDAIVVTPLPNSTCGSLPGKGLLAGGVTVNRTGGFFTKVVVLSVVKFYALLSS